MSDRPCRFATVQIIDPIRNERVNVGVVLFARDDSFADARFTTDWSRVAAVHGPDSAWAQDAVAEIQRGITAGELTLAMVEEAAARYGPYTHVIFAQLGTAIETPYPSVLEDVFARMVSTRPAPIANGAGDPP